MRDFLTFPKGGIHPPEHKEISERLPIEGMPVPDEVEILLQQHFGAPCSPLIKKKDTVAEGDMIGKVTAGLGACVHASVSGAIKNIGTSSHPASIKAPSITIQTDRQAPPKVFEPVDWKNLPRDVLLARIKEAGVVGIGGAGFPTHVKLAPPPEAKVDTLLLNGAECEPYLTTDHRIMLESPGEVVEGARIILAILGITDCRIGIEANKPDAIEAVKKAASERSANGWRISVAPLEVKYPQGSEKQLIQSITGRKVPGFGLPFDVGVIVQNVGTARAVYEAVCLGKPLYEKVITVSGKGISRPANLLVKIGTRLSDIVDYLGGIRRDLAKVVMGGPMMGFAIPSLDVPVMKTTSGVLFLAEDEADTSPHGHCIRCGWCLDACPMGLSPNEIGIYVEAGRAEETSQFGLFECFECGCCAFVCPARRPLVQFIRLAKMKAKR
ncbi:MAG: electron transport complex subunit RsxC [Desulfobacteraceae bacterium]|nr:MAG: electron transport complex subunit RsxC [Desulfobacteraceae bacterium]